MIGLHHVLRKKPRAAFVRAFKDIASDSAGDRLWAFLHRLVVGGRPSVKRLGKSTNFSADGKVADAQLPQGVVKSPEEHLLQGGGKPVARRRVSPQPPHRQKNVDRQDFETALGRVGRPRLGIEERRPRGFIQRFEQRFRLALCLIFPKPAPGHGRVPSPRHAGSSMPAAGQGCRMKFGRVLISFAVLASLQGCISYRSAHGYVLERGETELTAKTGIDTKESVLAKYGEPSMIGTFDRNRWYYLYSLDASRAFFKPKTTARTVIEFQFDDAGKVASVNEIGLADSVNVKMASRETPTRGKELGFWEQLLGNVGQLPAGGLGQQQGPPN